jgi:MFS family permease
MVDTGASVPFVSLKIKPNSSTASSLLPVALGTALVLITYVTPMASLPPTASSLDAGAATRAWMLSSMSIGLSAALLAAGVLGDNAGRRRIYGGGLLAVAVGALGCAVAREPILFIAGRILEGVGGAAILACGLAILANDYPPGPPRLHATSIWGASVGVGISSGAVLSAVFNTQWRESYAIVSVVAVILLWPTMTRITESSAGSRRKLDVTGILLFVTAMSCGISALTLGRSGVNPATVALTVSAVIAASVFAFSQTRVTAPLVDPYLWRHKRFGAATIGSFTLGAGIIAMASFVPTVVQVGLGSDLRVGALLVVAWSGTSVLTSYLLRHYPRPVEGPVPLAVFLAVVAVGQLIGYGLTSSSSPLRLVPSLVIAGVATGLLNTLLGREAVSSVDADRAAMGSGANNTARYLGAAIGITAFVVIATSVGEDVTAGWNRAVLVSAALTLSGAAAVALLGRRAGRQP